MNEFNLEEAKAGKPVCTRDGEPARIVCWDRKTSENKSIVALIDRGTYEDTIEYYPDGHCSGLAYHNDDLIMAPENSIMDVNLIPDYKERYKKIAESEWFKKAYKNKSIGFDYAPNESETYVVNFGYGWVCPICGRVYSPFVTMCPHCSTDDNNPLRNLPTYITNEIEQK